jgi:peroxiredoxin Q/BCP
MRTSARGTRAPDFELPDQAGRPRRLSTLLERDSVVLFFHPAALTAGCTKEACHFRDLHDEFADVGARPVGISLDRVDKQARFDAREGLGPLLLSDAGGSVAGAYGVRRRFLTPVKRATFVICRDGVDNAVVTSEFSMHVYSDQALAALRAGVRAG